MLSHVAGPNNFLGQTEAKARYSLVQSLARIWLQQNRIHRSYLEELLGRGSEYWRPDYRLRCRRSIIRATRSR